MLDFDGTVTPIVKTPQGAFLSEKAKRLLTELSLLPRVRVALVSGRALEDLKKRVGLSNVIYAGNHGLELEGPKIRFKLRASLKYKGLLSRIEQDLRKKLAGIRGVFIEDKGLSLSLHYRLVPQDKVPLVKTLFHETVILYLVKEEIRVKTGKKVLEIRPPTEWNKGRIVLWLLARQFFASAGDRPVPVYIGDDITDEDAFRALAGRGVTVCVGKPRRSLARYYLRDTKDVMRFLGILLKTWKNS